MQVKFVIQRQVGLEASLLEEKINNYLKRNSYRVIDNGPGFIIFIDDEFSDRKRSRSDMHKRIDKGKFEFFSNEGGTYLKLMHLNAIWAPAFMMILFALAGIYTKSIMPVFCSLVFTIPLIFKIFYLRDHVFDEILED